MARKNNVKSEHPGSILFDTRTRTVMAGPDSTDNIKEKVQSVREVVPGKSNNEIVLVLQYYDYNVEKAIQAYLEDGAKEALGEWHVPTSKPNKKKKNKKKAASSGQADSGMPSSAGGATASSAPASSSQSLMQTVSTSSIEPSSSIGGSISSKSPLPNGDISTGSIKVLEVTSSALLEGAAAAEPPPPTSALSSNTSVSQTKHQNHRAHSGSHGHGHGHGHGHQAHSHAQRTRTASERSTASSVGAGGDNHSRRPFQGLEKSIKDLQRQTTSIERLRLLLDHEIERSYKSIRTVFDEMRTHLNTREKELVTEMDVVNQQANDVFQMRQEKAALLKVHIDRAEKLSESELGELRADVKHFVADRKIDEELGKTTRFLYDSDHLKEEILRFGEVMPVKCPYSARRPSVSSVASSGHGVEDAPHLLSLQLNAVAADAATYNSPLVQDSSQLTAEELASLQTRLHNSLKIQGYENDGHPADGGSSAVSGSEDRNKTKSATRQNRNQDHEEQRRNEGESEVTNARSDESLSDSRAATPSSTHASAGSASPSPQRGQQSPRRSGGYRGRGRGGQGSGGYRGGQNQGRGSPRRPYSGGRGGYRGAGRDQTRQGGRPVAVNGSAS